MDFSDVDRAALTAAIRRLEEPGFAGRMTTLAGRPAELVARALPRPAALIVTKAAETALTRALDIALFSLRDQRFLGGRVVHSALASASGALGGALGLAALPVELPVSTAIMLRTIAKIAREEGEDLADPRTRLACLEVFALGHTGIAAPDGAEGGYFALRVLLARGLALAADTLVRKGAAHTNSALMHRALAPIVARFTAVVSQKLALQGVTVIGAIGGAAVNLAFIEQYHGLARGHFTVRRLERVYGTEAVRAEYDQLKTAGCANRCRQRTRPRSAVGRLARPRLSGSEPSDRIAAPLSSAGPASGEGEAVSRGGEPGDRPCRGHANCPPCDPCARRGA